MISSVYEQQGDTLRTIENYEKFFDLPRWIARSTEQNLFDTLSYGACGKTPTPICRI
jgi:hypothetical protein